MRGDTPEHDLERELSELLDRSASSRRPSSPPRRWSATSRSTSEAARRPRRPGGRSRPRELDWFVEPTEVARRLEPAVLQVVRRRQAERLATTASTATSRPGSGDRVAFYWRGEEGEEREVTYADLHRDVQRLANVLLDRGVEAGDVVGIYLPMIPEVAVAMLACARIGAPHNVVFGGFSPDAVKERMQFSEAKALITVDARPAQGQGGRDQAGGRRLPRRGAVDRDRGRRPQHRRRGRDDRGPRRLLRRGDRGRRRGVPAGRARRRAPALHPLHLGLDGEAEGDPAHHRRLPDRRRVDAQATSST